MSKKRYGSVRAIRSSSDGTFSSVLPTSIWYLGRVVHGIESLRKSVEINPNWGLSQFVLAGALALAGLLAEAAEVCAAAQCLVPNFTIARYRAEAISDNPVYLAQREYFDRVCV